jgi:DNA-binding NarL/FixJ family response regulator
MPERGNNGRYISSPKRVRSQRNKAEWAEMRAQEAEQQRQRDRQARIAELLAEGHSPSEISRLMSADLSTLPTPEQIKARRARKRQR